MTMTYTAHWTTQQHAASLLELDIVVLDTETTGLDDNDEIIEMGVIDKNGEVLIDCLVKPTRPVPDFITKINNIDNDMVEDMGQKWRSVALDLVEYSDRTFVMYNAVFDVRMIKQSHAFHKFAAHWFGGIFRGMPDLDFIAHRSVDLMELANRHFHQHLEWDEGKSCFKRLSLKKCCEIAGIAYPDDAHRAVPDCQVTLQLLQFIANDVPVENDVTACSKCGDRLGHEEDAGDVCRFCNEGWVPSDPSERNVACSVG